MSLVLKQIASKSRILAHGYPFSMCLNRHRSGSWPDTSNDFVPDDILRFWYGDLTSRDTEIPEDAKRKWFMGSKEVDDEIIKLFGGFMHIILDETSEIHKIWLSTLKGTVAYIIVADQLARNIYRGTPKAFEHDQYAQNVVNDCIGTGKDERIFNIHPAFNAFLYMPLMHSENIGDHDILRNRQQWMLDNLEKDHAFYQFVSLMANFENHHREIIEKFGRFPQRNEILGRESTQEELQYIKDHTSMECGISAIRMFLHNLSAN